MHNTVTCQETCRVCGAGDLQFLFSLGNQYVSDFVELDKVHAGIRAPITLVLCPHCSLVQLQHTAPQELLYSRHYWYRSGVTDTMRKALAEVAAVATAAANLQPGDVVLDLGANDGTLLRAYQGDVFRVGVEPADNLVEAGREGVQCLIHDFWNYESYQQHVGRPARVVTALGMFYDLQNPNQFIGDITKALAPDGVFIAQLMCLQNMLNVCDLGNLAHEHLEFYTLKSLDFMFNKHGLELVDLETNTVNGQSYRLFIRPVGGSFQPASGAAERLDAARQAEVGLDQPEFFHDFYARMEANKHRVVDFIRQAVADGKRVWAYGMSTKGNVILQYYGLDVSLIEAGSDRSPEKWGKYTIGTGIPIVSEQIARDDQPDYFLILPYAFLSEFLARESAWREQGGRFIVPLPEFRVI